MEFERITKVPGGQALPYLAYAGIAACQDWKPFKECEDLR